MLTKPREQETACQNGFVTNGVYQPAQAPTLAFASSVVHEEIVLTEEGAATLDAILADPTSQVGRATRPCRKVSEGG